MYRLSDHSLEIETGRHRKQWQPREERTCKHCGSGEIETESHFLLSCPIYATLREAFLGKVKTSITSYDSKTYDERLSICLGEAPELIELSAQYVSACHELREKKINTVT
ncbi:hypothetical protein COCON_G00201570 [Conger conger]|uniref:Uncharacterized protein n=1 Tax=Conger conger TaxID=82655 RepID=A0A9Q1CYH6_CONCO|nr:hypothetical protein COCON_G00201570 [Conger conger]